LFRFFTHTKDAAVSALTIIFSISIFAGGFISTLFSGGYLLFLIGLFFIRLKDS